MRITFSTPPDLMHRLQRDRARRACARTLLRVRQSKAGMALAAKLANGPDLAHQLGAIADARAVAAASFLDMASGTGIIGRTRSDVAGSIHRAWLRALSRTGDEAILDEVDRGEDALRRSLVRLLNRRVDARVHRHLARLHVQVCEDIERLKAERMRRAGPFQTGNQPVMPSFRAPASTGQTLDAERYRGKLPLVLFFVPDGFSRRSGRRIAAFNRALLQFGELRTQVIGVVPETASDLRDQASRHNYNLPLLADPDGAIHRAFGLDKEDAALATAVIDRTGTIVRIIEPARGPGHVRQVLATIRALKDDAETPMEPIVGS